MFEIEKRKVKTKKLLKIDTYQMNKSPHFSQKTQPKQCKPEVEKIFINQKTGKVKSSQTLFRTLDFTMIKNTTFNNKNKHRNKNSYNSSNQKSA